MLRTAILNSVRRPVALSIATRRTAVRNMSEGSTGSGFSRAGGEAQGDSFTKREKANEDFYVRKKELEKLAALKEKLKQQRQHLDELDKHIEEYTKEQGGEHN